MKSNTPFAKWTHPFNSASASFKKSLRALNLQLTRKNVTTTDFVVNSIDQDFFSDFTESPILTFFIHMVAPCKQGHNPSFLSNFIGKRFSF